MTRLDKWAGGLLLGFAILTGCFCIGFGVAFLLGGEVMFGAVVGAALGVVVDILALGPLVRRLFSMGFIPLVFFYLLYSVFIFGFFMGVPVFIVLMGLVAGWYTGRRSRVREIEAPAFRKALQGTQLWCASVLLVACFASAYLALSDPYTAQNLEGMLSLSFAVTREMIWGLILIGGAALLLVQALFVRLAARLSYR